MNAIAAEDFTLDYIFESLNALPAFPKVVQKAMELLDDPETTMEELAEVLKYDQALTANILRLTNSAHFGVSRQVTSLETALALLGQQQIRQVLIASASMPFLAKETEGYNMQASDLWAHGMGCAIISEAVAARCDCEEPAALFTAALLHDIGKTVMHLYVGPRLKEIVTRANSQNVTFTEAEWEVLGGDHAVIGSDVLRKWEFPPDIVRAVRNHHDPDLYMQDDLSAMLALSDIFTVQLGIGVGVDGFRYKINPELPARLGMDQRTLHQCMLDGYAAYQKASDMLSLIAES
jgi:putative nucleotidyltransferase with HDIG domain